MNDEYRNEEKKNTPPPCTGKECNHDKSTCPRHRILEEAVDKFLKRVREKLVNGDVAFGDFVIHWSTWFEPSQKNGIAENQSPFTGNEVRGCGPSPVVSSCHDTISSGC